MKEQQSLLINRIKSIDEGMKVKDGMETNIGNLFPAFYSKLTNLVLNKVSKKNKRGLHIGFKYNSQKIDPFDFESVLLLFDTAYAAAELLSTSKTNLQPNLCLELKRKLSDLFDKQFLHLTCPLKMSDVKDINSKMERFYNLSYMFAFKSSPEFLEHRNKVRPLYYETLDLIYDGNSDSEAVSQLMQVFVFKYFWLNYCELFVKILIAVCSIAEVEGGITVCSGTQIHSQQGSKVSLRLGT